MDNLNEQEKKFYDKMLLKYLTEQKDTLSEEEINEILGALKGIAGVGKALGQKIGGAVKGAVDAVAGSIQKAGQAVYGQVKNQYQDLANAYQKASEEGKKQELQMLLNLSDKSIIPVIKLLVNQVNLSNKYRLKMGMPEKTIMDYINPDSSRIVKTGDRME